MGRSVRCGEMPLKRRTGTVSAATALKGSWCFSPSYLYWEGPLAGGDTSKPAVEPSRADVT